MGRLKTGTPPRLHSRSIDFSKLERQDGDAVPKPFSHFNMEISNPQLPSWVAYTNAATHQTIRDNLRNSPLYCGKIEGVGPRYCPSIEDKVVKFPQKARHQLFSSPKAGTRARSTSTGCPPACPRMSSATRRVHPRP